MSFNVELWTFSKAPNSTAQPTTTSAVFKCVSNEDFNIIEPRVPLQLGPANNPTSYNYAKITVFNRYYWVTRWAFEGGLWVAYMRVDPLASWKSEIGGLSAYVLRSAAAYNGNIRDGLYPVKSPTSSRTFLSDPWEYTYLNQKYVIGIVGNNSTTSYYVMSGSELSTFMQTIFGDPFFNDVDNNQSLRKADFNPMQYITSLRRFPLGAPGITTTSRIWLGYWDTGIDAAKISPSNRTYTTYTGTATLTKHSQASTRGTFLNNSPYLEYTMFMPPFGLFQLPGQYFNSSASVSWDVTVDWINGNGILIIKNDDGVIAFQSQAVVGMLVQISQVLTQPQNLTSNVIGRASTALADMMLGSSQGMGLGPFEALMPVVTTQGTDAGHASIFCYAWTLMTVETPLVDEDLTDRGRPLCEKRTLSTLSGYQLCADVDVTIPCTRDEEQMIKGFLESGYFYE